MEKIRLIRKDKPSKISRMFNHRHQEDLVQLLAINQEIVYVLRFSIIPNKCFKHFLLAYDEACLGLYIGLIRS